MTADSPLGRYALLAEIARGGMATVHVGRLVGPGGFGRTVAIKRLHTHLAEDDEFVSMLLDEARLAGRIQHPNVVAMLDVVTNDKEVLLVMEYVDGESLYKLLREAKKREKRIPANVASAILIDSLRGLAAAHEAKNERGEPLDIVHRDFTPQNIMVRRDGTSLVVDFGIAKAVGRLHTTEEGKIKGKLPYMAPEQVRGEQLDRRVDVYAAGAVLWEALVGERAVRGNTEAEVLERLLYGTIAPPSQSAADIPPAVDDVVLRAVKRDQSERFATAAEMQRALENALPPALPSRVADWLAELFGESLSKRADRVAELERELVDQGSQPRTALTVIEKARPIPEPATPASKREVPSQNADPTSGALAVTTVDNQRRVDSAASGAESTPRRSTLRGALSVALIAVAMGGSYAAWTAVRAKGSAEAATTPPSVSPPSPTSATTSNAIEKPVPSAAPAPSSTASPTPSATATTRVPVVVPPGPPLGPNVVKPVHKNCSPVTIDPKGQKVYHPECMGNDP